MAYGCGEYLQKFFALPGHVGLSQGGFWEEGFVFGAEVLQDALRAPELVSLGFPEGCSFCERPCIVRKMGRTLPPNQKDLKWNTLQP